MIEFRRNAGAVALCEVLNTHAFRHVLTDQSVGVFIGAAFRGVMGRGEIELRGQRGFELFVPVKFGAVVGRDGVHGSLLRTNQGAGPCIESGAGSPREFADHRKPRFAIDQREQTGAALAVSQLRVSFPMSQSRTVFRTGRPRRNRALAAELSSTVIVGLALPKRLVRAPQMHVQRAALMLVAPDVAKDRFVIDQQHVIARASARDLLRTPIDGRVTPRPSPSRSR